MHFTYLRGHSQTTWTSFRVFLTPSPLMWTQIYSYTVNIFTEFLTPTLPLSCSRSLWMTPIVDFVFIVVLILRNALLFYYLCVSLFYRSNAVKHIILGKIDSYQKSKGIVSKSLPSDLVTNFQQRKVLALNLLQFRAGSGPNPTRNLTHGSRVFKNQNRTGSLFGNPSNSKLQK